MSWSRVNSKTIKPLKWWYYKILCEIGWLIRYKDNYSMYHNNLNKLWDIGFNLYGEKI